LVRSSVEESAELAQHLLGAGRSVKGLTRGLCLRITTAAVFDVGTDHKLSNRRLFTACTIDEVKCGPDGVRCDVDGNVWISSNAGRALGYSGVTVWNPAGTLIGRIRLPEVCANLAFGGPKRNRLFMAASQSLYAVYVNTQGATPG
jgi:gluconolactonase